VGPLRLINLVIEKPSDYWDQPKKKWTENGQGPKYIKVVKWIRPKRELEQKMLRPRKEFRKKITRPRKEL
jgi:hypothetical protein